MFSGIGHLQQNLLSSRLKAHQWKRQKRLSAWNSSLKGPLTSTEHTIQVCKWNSKQTRGQTLTCFEDKVQFVRMLQFQKWLFKRRGHDSIENNCVGWVLRSYKLFTSDLVNNLIPAYNSQIIIRQKLYNE